MAKLQLPNLHQLLSTSVKACPDGLEHCFSSNKWVISCFRGVRTLTRKACAFFSSFWQCKETDDKNMVRKKCSTVPVWQRRGGLFGQSSYGNITFQKGASLTSWVQKLSSRTFRCWKDCKSAFSSPLFCTPVSGKCGSRSKMLKRKMRNWSRRRGFSWSKNKRVLRVLSWEHTSD